MQVIVATILLSSFSLTATLSCLGADGAIIVIGTKATAVEHYAAKELQRYLYQLSATLPKITSDTDNRRWPAFVLGQAETNPAIQRLVDTGQLTVSAKNPGQQGYVLKKFDADGREVLVIAGSDAIGCLYGVYGLLEDYYGLGFYLGGDILPVRSALRIPSVDQRKRPAVAIRGFLPWTNFPQSATVYSWQDWRFIIDQMAKMRMNFLHIHNYNETGLKPQVIDVPRHNEMFHNFTCRGITSRVWMATVRTGHFWGMPRWDLSRYRFGAGDLFDDYDFGADCALHNEHLSNEQAFRKGVSLFQKVIVYAHARGVRIGLGLDINLIPDDYKAKADDPDVIAARVDQIATDYPGLDYLICFVSEGSGGDATWQRIFRGFYDGIQKRAPRTRLAVAGWGLDAEPVAKLPADVICAPISAYSARCESGAIYGNREYWGCPWLERDGNCSEYYYPYNIHLSNTIKAWQGRAPNMKGFYCLTWRLTDAIDPKISYVAKAPWDHAGKYNTSRAVYHEYAVMNYGRNVAERITAIIDQNEPVASTWGECGITPPFQGGASDVELNKAVRQLAVIDGAISTTAAADCKARLRLLRCRIAAARDHMELDRKFAKYAWGDLPGAMESWAHNFMYRVNDISALGNVVSMQNRFVQLNYEKKEDQLRNAMAIQPPADVVARGLRRGAVIHWTNKERNALGFHVYRNGEKLTVSPLPAAARSYTDVADGRFRYAVSAVTATGVSLPSVPCTCEAGNADHTPPHAVLVSPPTSVAVGQPAWLTVRVLDGRSWELISATLCYREPGAQIWRKTPMARRVKAVFAAEIPAGSISDRGVEYYVKLGDGDNVALYPPSAPERNLSFVVSNSDPIDPPAAPAGLRASGRTLTWTATDPRVCWHRVYRGRSPDFVLGPDTFLTYTAKDTLVFTDSGYDLEGRPLQGAWYYRLTSVDQTDKESPATSATKITY